MSDARSTLRHLDLKHLRQLMEVAERGSIRAAANALAITQPALSRSIRAMEEAVDARLIERGPRGAALTPVGETLLKYAKIIDANIALAERELHDLRTLRRRAEHVSFGMSWLAESVIAAPLINALKIASPGLRLTTVIGDYETLAPRLASGKLDFFLGPPPLQSPAIGVSTELVTEFPAVVLVRPEHPFARAAEVTYEELAAAQWVLPNAGTLPRIRYDNFFLHHGVAPPQPVLEVQPLSPIIRRLIRKWDLVTILPRVVVERDIADGMLVPLPFDETIVFAIHVTRRQLGFPSPASERAVQEIKRLCADHGNFSAE
jgi:LysR family transcriptional regulator, pca operon transcriptional activator